MGLKRILTTLDTHLDTRLGTIARLDQKAAATLLDSNEYWLRENDFWFELTKGKITDVEFKEAYAQRGGVNTKATLEASVRTGITPFIVRILADDHINQLSQMGNPEDQVSMTVNYWPYELNSEELEWLRDIFNEIYSNTLVIELVSIPMDELTPNLLNENFAACIMYEFLEWIHMHTEALGKIRISCFNFIGPKIFEQDVSNATVEAKQQSLNAFRMLHLIHMDFEFIDAKYFSVINVHGK